MTTFRMRSATGQLIWHLLREDEAGEETEFPILIDYSFEPAQRATWDEPGCDVGAWIESVSPPIKLTKDEESEIRSAIIEAECDRQEGDYEHAMEMRWEASRGN